jgi:hypothetical protein
LHFASPRPANLKSVMVFLQSRLTTCLLLALLCVITYGPTLNIPLVEDDYPNITLARDITRYTHHGFAKSVLLH